MRFRHACIEAIASALPGEVLTSAEIESRLSPLYERLKLPAGRLELMTGIRERRIWPAGTRASDASAAAARAVLQRSEIGPEQVELFIHASVCRDMLEPATASFAHEKVGLGPNVQVFDLSNACLGFANALTVAASMIDAGQIRCALVAVGENGRPLVEHTIETLLAGQFTRNGIKPFFANLTIGCGAAAAMICHESLLRGGGHRIVSASVMADSAQSRLCQGDSAGADALAMRTDSEQLLEAGVALAARTWEQFKRDSGWAAPDVDRFIGHQVGAVHRRRVFEALGLDLSRDFSTFETLGNMGSASLPATLAAAAEAGAVKRDDRVVLFGIGSGLNCLLAGVQW